MSDKKKLLSESEIRRFMVLANIPSLNESYGIGQENQEEYEMQEAAPPEDDAMAEPQGMGDEPAADEAPPEEEPMGDEPEGDVGGGGKEDKLKEIFKMIAELADVEIDLDGEGGEDSDSEEVDLGSISDEEDGEEADEEEAEQDGEEEGEEEEELEESEEALQESLVKAVMSRVTTRLMAEAKSKKEKKESFKDKMAKLRKKKAKKGDKKLEEANAPAPKATSTNAPKKGAGSATKGNWGVNEKVPDQSWEKGTSKRGHKMEDVTPSTEHITTHGKKNLATMGGNKKK